MDVFEQQEPTSHPIVPPLPPSQAPVVMRPQRSPVITLMAVLLLVFAGQGVSAFLSVLAAFSSHFSVTSNPALFWYALVLPIALLQLVAGVCLFAAARWARGTALVCMALAALVALGREAWMLLPLLGLSSVFGGSTFSYGNGPFGILGTLLRVGGEVVMYGAMLYFLTRPEEARDARG
jgi:hypothetical protein